MYMVVYAHHAVGAVLLTQQVCAFKLSRFAFCPRHHLARGAPLHPRRRHAQRRRRHKAIEHRRVPHKHLLIRTPAARKHIGPLRRRLDTPADVLLTSAARHTTAHLRGSTGAHIVVGRALHRVWLQLDRQAAQGAPRPTQALGSGRPAQCSPRRWWTPRLRPYDPTDRDHDTHHRNWHVLCEWLCLKW